MSIFSNKFLIIIALFISTTAGAATVTTNYNSAVSIGDTLNTFSASSQSNGSFDISSILSDYTNFSGFTINSAVISASAYSTADSRLQIVRGPAPTTFTTTYRDTSYGYYVDEPCGWGGTCSKLVRVSRTARDTHFSRDVDYITSDQVVDKMNLHIGGSVFSETVESTYNQHYGATRQVGRTGSWAYGYSYEYEDPRYITDISAGSINLQQNIAHLLNNALSSNLSVLDWTIFATVGQFDLRTIRLAVDYSYDSAANVSAVPLPAAAFMFGPALLGFLGLRRKVKNTVS
ncbi:MAG: hypothetical protein ACKE8G_02890 [Methylophagaceae bacterium]